MWRRIRDFNDRHATLVVWLLRLAVGAVFVFSGFVKVVDPWGFYYKIMEYLSVWHIAFVSREVVQTAAVALAMTEFTCGVFLLLGAMRRSVVVVLSAMMAVMLPLTVYIYVAEPVSDCGCFGEAVVLSNFATMMKNVALTLALLYLLRFNGRARCLINPMTQWVALVACVVYCLVLGVFGYGCQPLVDFRPYPVGAKLLPAADEGHGLRLVYERDGEEREFDLDELPDSTWTYVRRVEAPAQGPARTFAVFDGDEDVTDEVIAEEGPQMLLVVSEPRMHERARASMANNINDYIRRRGGTMIGLVATDEAGLERWNRLTRPDFPTYTSEDTSLKELVRGVAALVYLEDGVIQWKRNIYSLPGDYPDFDTKSDELHNIYIVDDGRLISLLTALLLMILLLLVVTSLRGPRKKTRLKAIRLNAKP